MCALIFSPNLFDIFLFYEDSSRYYVITNVYRSSCKVHVILVRFY